MGILISILSFLLPTQLSYHFLNLSQPVYGFTIDYLIPAVYLSDIVILLIFLVWLIKNNFKFNLNRRHVTYITIYLIFTFVNVLNASHLVAAIYKWIKVTELILLGLIIYKYKKFDVFKHFVKPLSLSIIIGSILGVLQQFKGGSVGGLFYWMGERSFNFSNPGISPHPYSFFSHPNSFAGFLLVYLIFVIEQRKKFNRIYFYGLVLLISANIVLAGSLNVYLAIIFLLILKSFTWFKLHSKVLPLIAVDLTARTITHRVELIKASLEIIKGNFLIGVGMNNFIPKLTEVSKSFLNSWELQPVHNIFLLTFSEIGIFGLIAFLYLLFLAGLNSQIVVIIFTGLSDHYWLTLQQNLLLLTFVIALSLKRKKK